MSHSSKLIKPKKGIFRNLPSIARDTDDNLDLASEVGRVGRAQFCESKALICGIRPYLQVDGIRIELSWRIPNRCLLRIGELFGGVGKTHWNVYSTVRCNWDLLHIVL